MKKPLSILVVFLIGSFFLPVQAQFSIMGGIDYNISINGVGKPINMLSLSGTGLADAYDNSMGIFLKFNYFLPSKFTKEVYLASTAGYPPILEAEGKLSFIFVQAGMRKYFKEGNSEEGGFYVVGSMGMIVGNVQYTFPGYNSTYYSVYSDSAVSGKYTDVKLTLGAGKEFRLSEFMFLSIDFTWSTHFMAFAKANPVRNPVKYMLSPGVGIRYIPWQ